MAAPMKNEGKVTISPTTSTSAAKTVALATSIGIRRGTASRDARVTPVEYSLDITRTPRTQMVSWPNSSPEPRIVLTGSDMIWARCEGSLLVHCRMVSQVNRPVKPKVTTTSSASDQRAERAERFWAHAEGGGRPTPAPRDRAGAPGPPSLAAGTGGLAEVILCPPAPWPGPARPSPAGLPVTSAGAGCPVFE